MASRTIIERRIKFREATLEKLYEAYEALASGRVKSYTIDDRSLTYHSLPDLADEIRTMEQELDELQSQLNGAAGRRAFGVLPRDW